MISEQAKKVLKEINDSIPKEWLNQLTSKVWANPVIRKVVDKGLADPEVTGELRTKLETIKMSDVYKEEVEVINEDIERKIDEHLTRKVRQATKEGRLPPLRKEDFNVRKLKKEGIEKETTRSEGGNNPLGSPNNLPPGLA